MARKAKVSDLEIVERLEVQRDPDTRRFSFVALHQGEAEEGEGYPTRYAAWMAGGRALGRIRTRLKARRKMR